MTYRKLGASQCMPTVPNQHNINSVHTNQDVGVYYTCFACIWGLGVWFFECLKNARVYLGDPQKYDTSEAWSFSMHANSP